VSAFIDERRGDFGVELICRTLEVSASAYYQRATGRRSARSVEDERLLGVIRQVHACNYEAYGSRRMWKALLRAGERVGRGHVERLMAVNGICGAKRRGKPWRTTIAGVDAARSPDLVNRDFTASAANRTWVADFTYVRCWEGVVFLQLRARRLLAAPGGLAVRAVHQRPVQRRPHRSRATRSSDRSATPTTLNQDSRRRHHRPGSDSAYDLLPRDALALSCRPGAGGVE
jgi:transposase InsO family protein